MVSQDAPNRDFIMTAAQTETVPAIKNTRDTSERRRQISAIMRDRGSVQVVTLSAQFGVSMQTIRKDLHYLEEHGVAARAYGGAILASVVNASEPRIKAERVRHIDEKERIGRMAAAMIAPGDSVMIASGANALQIANYIPDSEEITIVTNDFGVLSVLTPKQHIKIVMLGGAFRRKNMAFYGTQAMSALNGLSLDKLFLGIEGFDLEKGITTQHEPEALLNRKMVKTARRVIAVTDASKFGKACLHRIIDVREIDDLITDAGAPDDIRAAALRVPFRLHLA